MSLTLVTFISPEWFEQQATWLLLLLGAAAMVLVMKGADWLVAGAAGLAHRLGVPTLVIGATIVSVGTTSPEAAVSVMAAWGGNAGLALGNGVGSIIVNTGLIFGLGILIAGRMPADRFLLRREGRLQTTAVCLLAGLCYVLFIFSGDQAVIPRWAGLSFVFLLFGYMALSVRWARRHPPPTVSGMPEGESFPPKYPLPALLGLGAVGLAMVMVGADGLVGSASVVAMRWGVPEVVLAATLVALGTSLPELAIGLTAIRRGYPELMLGNIIGANILNVLFVVGAAATASPLPIVEGPDVEAGRFLFLQLHLPTMLLLIGLMRVEMGRALVPGHFNRWMGLPLIALYLIYLIIQLIITA